MVHLALKVLIFIGLAVLELKDTHNKDPQAAIWGPCGRGTVLVRPPPFVHAPLHASWRRELEQVVDVGQHLEPQN